MRYAWILCATCIVGCDEETRPMDARADVQADRVFTDLGINVDDGRDAGVFDGVSVRDVPTVTADVVLSCDRRFALSPARPRDDQGFDVRFTDPTPWANIGLAWMGGAPSWRFVDVVARDPFTWLFHVEPTAAGRYTVSFTADSGARSLGACTFDVASTGAVTDVPNVPVDAVGPRPDVPNPPNGVFVTRVGTEFNANAARFRYIGMNSAGLPHYGAGPLMFARVEQISAELDEMQRMGVRVVRVFAAAEDADAATVTARVGRVLDLAQARGIWVLLALTDFYATTAYHPQGDRRFYARDPRFAIDLLSPEFFRSGFRTNYLPWVRTLVTRFAAHPAVFAWELGNEIKCDDDHRAFISFASETSNLIRSLDARHLITTGMITARWASDAEARELYRLPNLDFITYHNYNGTMEFADFDYAVAADVGKPLIVEEAAFDSGDRGARADTDIRAHFDLRGARGYMQWGFTVIAPDNGNGDRQWGMDRVFHGADYDALARTYTAAAARYR